MKISKVGNFAIRINDIRLNNLSDKERVKVLELLQVHDVITFSNQQLSANECVQFCKFYGKVAQTNAFFTHSDHKEIIQVSNNIESRNNGLFPNEEIDWHTAAADRLNSNENILFLYCLKSGNEVITSFANMRHAWKGLSTKEQEISKNLIGRFGFTSNHRDNFTPREQNYFSSRQGVTKKLYRDHPITSERALFLPVLKLDAILNLELAPQGFINHLKEHFTSERYIYHHHWKPGDVVIADQSMTHHKRTIVQKERLLYRLIFDYSH
jgi:alpha-ketoglutarate-dependent taurine dioxygenase